MSDKIFYSTNWMGPIRQSWIEEHGEDWSGGRIDVYGGDLGPYGEEIGLPLMKSKDWINFSDWLDGFYTIKEVYSLDDILEEYYAENNPEITWFNEKSV